MLLERLGSDAKLQVFSDADAREALDFIIREKPSVIAVDRDFSSSPRGRAFIDRISSDQNLATCEVRVLTRDAVPTAAGVTRDAGVSAAAAVAPRPPLDQHGTRRVPRVRMAPGVAVLVEGSAATLVDLSIAGAQVLSHTVLKPNQRVRLQLADGVGAIRCKGTVAWALFEMPKGLPTRYRVGIELFGADAEALTAFARRHEAAAVDAAEAVTSAADRPE